jgi:hypothetical protein
LTEEERETMPPYVNVPNEPLYNRTEDRALYEEQQVGRVELLMTKGVRGKRALKGMLNMTQAEVDRYIPRVHARWEMFGASRDHARHRGEGLHRLDMVEQRLWMTIQEKPGSPPIPARELAKITRSILEVQKQRNVLLGLTPKVIERLDMDVGNNLNFSNSAATHQRMAMMAPRMLEIIEERYGRKEVVNEHEPSSPDA